MLRLRHKTRHVLAWDDHDRGARLHKLLQRLSAKVGVDKDVIERQFKFCGVFEASARIAEGLEERWGNLEVAMGKGAGAFKFAPVAAALRAISLPAPAKPRALLRPIAEIHFQ